MGIREKGHLWEAKKEERSGALTNQATDGVKVSLVLARDKNFNCRSIYWSDLHGLICNTLSDHVCYSCVAGAGQHEVPMGMDDKNNPLSEISDEDMCLLPKMFNQQANEEISQNASVDWVTMLCMKEMLCDLPDVPMSVTVGG
ncbi:FAD/NAD(P)-binding domain containing protein [Melia azedarach]|nr:FAD/NAD(P)-binding domain containing protein [Melia azedarach]